jgi:hypothetical protein
MRCCGCSSAAPAECELDQPVRLVDFGTGRPLLRRDAGEGWLQVIAARFQDTEEANPAPTKDRSVICMGLPRLDQRQARPRAPRRFSCNEDVGPGDPNGCRGQRTRSLRRRRVVGVTTAPASLPGYARRYRPRTHLLARRLHELTSWPGDCTMETICPVSSVPVRRPTRRRLRTPSQSMPIGRSPFPLVDA